MIVHNFENCNLETALSLFRDSIGLVRHSEAMQRMFPIDRNSNSLWRVEKSERIVCICGKSNGMKFLLVNSCGNNIVEDNAESTDGGGIFMDINYLGLRKRTEKERASWAKTKICDSVSRGIAELYEPERSSSI